MSAARQRLRRFDQTAGMRTRSAASDCIVRTVLFGSDPLKTLKVDGKRSPENGINPLVEIWVLYGCASFADFPCRVKTTLKRFLDNNFPSKAYSYEISNIEILRGTAAPVARPSNKISMDAGILLNGVCDVNGVPLLDVCEIEDAANGS